MRTLPSPNITAELATHLRHRDLLLQRLPEIDDETLADTLEGLTNLHEMLAAVVQSALIDEALASGLKGRIDVMRERLTRLVERASRKREAALGVMIKADIRKIADPEFTASLRRGAKKVLVEHEEQVPAHYWVPQPPRLNRQLLLSDMKAGSGVPGASLIDGEVQLGVRVR